MAQAAPWLLHANPGKHRPAPTWWGEPLPSQVRNDKGQVVGVTEVGWWTQPRLAALVLWLGNGQVRSLARALAGTPAERLDYALGRAHARWVADCLIGMADDPTGQALRLLGATLPADRVRRAERGAARLEQVAELLPTPPPHAKDLALYALAHLRLVEAVGDLWPPRCHPARQVPGIDDCGEPTMGTLLPERRAPIDHDARMRAAEGLF
jgi:hypothetical protein